MKNSILSFLVCSLVSVSCSNTPNTGIAEEKTYIVEPTIYYGNTTTDIPVPVVDNSDGPVITNDIENKLTAAVADYLTVQKPQGMSISVYADGGGEWSYVDGYSDPEKRSAVSESTLFHSASSGKMIMATIIFSLIQDGYLRLDEPISKWFGDEALFDGVTIDHLLSHTSGIVSFEIIREFQGNKRTWSEEDLVDLVIRNQKRKLFEPGSALHYSNTGYVMLGMIAKKVTGETLGSLLDTRINGRTGSGKLLYLSEENYTDFVTASFDENGDYIQLLDPLYATGPHGAGAFAGTPFEFARFLNALLAGNIINTATLKAALSNLRLCEDTAQAKVYYGRGFKLIRITEQGNESRYIGHAGQYTGFGFTSQLYHSIDRHVTVAIMTNQTVVTDPLMFKLAEAFSN